MDRVLSLEGDFLEVRAQTGILGELLERHLRQAGLTLGHFPSSLYAATLGGFLACRSAGQLSTKYGKIEDMVRALQVCLADGRVVELDSSDGMNLKEIFLGSEGTLGVITEASLSLHPAPESECYRGIRFPSVEKGLLAIRRFLQAGIRPSVVRCYDPLDTLIFLSQSEGESASWFKKIFNQLPPALRKTFQNLQSGSLRWLLSQSAFVNGLIDLSLSKALLIVGFQGPSWKVNAELAAVIKICKEERGEDLGEEVGLGWLKKRYSISYKMSPIVDQGCFADTMEVAAPWSRLVPLYGAVRDAIQGDVLVMAHFSHAYADGCSIYFIFAGYRKSAEESLELHREIWKKALRACLDHGGTISHHHGIGSLKAEAFVEELGPLHGWFKKVKRRLDPHGILNPGKMGL
jgi:alkyldihydroxyacetonephosphate synthase